MLVLGRHDNDGRLRAVGRTVLLRPDTARQVAEHLTAPGHPWTGVRFSATWGSRDVLDTILVPPPPWSPRSAPIAPATAEASTATRSASSGCAWIWASRTYPGSVKVRRRPPADRAGGGQWRFIGEPVYSGG
ncbi:hypothetical protein [Streptomyces virginiae]|uniref:Uncharacterized protein n=1 Tax=Streptomyces virginiae TaxID=1961 RepID=A0ABZ1TPM5_STRVG|nr:hypothetical protein [Streptomyces virginiae]